MTSMTFLSLVMAAGGADGHAEGHWDMFKLVSQYLNFFILFGFIAFVVRKPLMMFLEQRRENMAGQLRIAQEKQAQAEKRLAEYASKLEHLEEEIGRVVKSFEAQGEADRQRMIQDADRAAERLVREVDFTIRQESIKATKAIREAGVQATLAMAEKLIVERITDSDRRRLADEYVAQVNPSTMTPGPLSMPPPKGPSS